MRRSVLAALLLAALAASPQVHAQTVEDCYQATLKDDDLAIIRVCSAALEKGGINNEDRSIALSNRGLGYLRNKEFDKSIIDFSDALLINPKNAYSFNFRGDAWLQKSNYDRAHADFEEALKIDTAFTGAIYNRGLTYERQGNVTAARAEYRKAIATRGDRALDKWARDRSQERLTALGDNPPQQKQQPRSDDRTGERDAGPRETAPRTNERTTDPRGNEGVYRRTR